VILLPFLSLEIIPLRHRISSRSLFDLTVIAGIIGRV